MGHVLVGESSEKKFKVKSMSAFPITYEIKVEAHGLSNKTKERKIFTYEEVPGKSEEE